MRGAIGRRSLRGFVALALCGGGLTVAAAPAGAVPTITVSLTYITPYWTMKYNALAGQHNAVRLIMRPSVFELEDSNHALSAGPGCDAVPDDPHSVRCLRSGITDEDALIVVNLGDLTDTFTISRPDSRYPHTRIDGGDGNDTLTKGSWNDKFLGGAGADTLGGAAWQDGGDGPDILRGTPENEHLEGGDGNDTLYGGAGDDYLFGESGADKLFGQDGADTLTGGTGPDLLSGGTSYEGSDEVSYADHGAGVRANLADAASAGARDDGNASDGPIGARDSIRADVEFLTGTKYADTLTGTNTPLSNAKYTLDGGGGDDVLYGRDGPYYFTHELYGGTGDDRIYIALGGNHGSIVHGDGGDDRIYGNADGQAIWGGTGADTIYGYGGPDAIYGEDGADSLFGGAGNDGLFGGDQYDTIDGGADDDACYTQLQPQIEAEPADGTTTNCEHLVQTG